MAFGADQIVCIKNEDNNIVYETFEKLSKYRSEYKVFQGDKFVPMKLKEMAKHKLLKITLNTGEEIICTENQQFDSVVVDEINNEFVIKPEEAKNLNEESRVNKWINSGWYDKYVLNSAGGSEWFDPILKKKIEMEKTSHEINSCPIRKVEQIDGDLTYTFTISNKYKQMFVLPLKTLLESRDECFTKEKSVIKTKKGEFQNRCIKGMIINL